MMHSCLCPLKRPLSSFSFSTLSQREWLTYRMEGPGCLSGGVEQSWHSANHCSELQTAISEKCWSCSHDLAWRLFLITVSPPWLIYITISLSLTDSHYFPLFSILGWNKMLYDVCMFMYVQLHMYVHVEARGQSWVSSSGVLSTALASGALTDSSIRLDWLSSKLFGILLSLSAWCWDHRSVPLCLSSLNGFRILNSSPRASEADTLSSDLSSHTQMWGWN